VPGLAAAGEMVLGKEGKGERESMLSDDDGGKDGSGKSRSPPGSWEEKNLRSPPTKTKGGKGGLRSAGFPMQDGAIPRVDRPRRGGGGGGGGGGGVDNKKKKRMTSGNLPSADDQRRTFEGKVVN